MLNVLPQLPVMGVALTAHSPSSRDTKKKQLGSLRHMSPHLDTARPVYLLQLPSAGVWSPETSKSSMQYQRPVGFHGWCEHS